MTSFMSILFLLFLFQPEFLQPFILLPRYTFEMHSEVKSLAIPATTVVADIFFLALMKIQMLLKVALLSEAHAAALHVALEWFILGVAPQMGEVLTQGRDDPIASLIVAQEDLGVPFRGHSCHVIHCVIARAWNVFLEPYFFQKTFLIFFACDFGGCPLGLDFV